jgi:hypothetical protein
MLEVRQAELPYISKIDPNDSDSKRESVEIPDKLTAGKEVDYIIEHEACDEKMIISSLAPSDPSLMRTS